MIGFFITLPLLFICSAPQEAHTGHPELYLGQNSPGMTPEIFAPGIVSIEEGKEYKITFSPDLREIVFTRRTPRARNDRLWYCRFEDGKINTPVLAPFGHDCLEFDPSFTPDGMRIYFASFRPVPGESTPSRMPKIWFVEKAGDSWGEPQLLESRLGEIIPVYLSFEKNGTLYFTNRRPREICTAVLKDGEYTDFKRLPDEINYLPNVAHPAVAPDGSFIIVDSIIEKHDHLVGSLYISFRKPDGSWTRAASMKEVLQATDADIYAAPRVTPDGKFIFFERYVRDTDKSDIYWVDARVVDVLRP